MLWTTSNTSPADLLSTGHHSSSQRTELSSSTGGFPYSAARFPPSSTADLLHKQPLTHEISESPTRCEAKPLPHVPARGRSRPDSATLEEPKLASRPHSESGRPNRHRHPAQNVERPSRRWSAGSSVRSEARDRGGTSGGPRGRRLSSGRHPSVELVYLGCTGQPRLMVRGGSPRRTVAGRPARAFYDGKRRCQVRVVRR